MSATKATETSSAEHASASPAAPASAAPIGLVQQLGNHGLQALLRARLMQAKLAVSHPQDSFEQEADRVAEQVMRMPTPVALQPVGAIQRVAADGRDVHRFSTASDVPAVDAATEQSIQSLSGRGSPLPDSVRSFMEPRFDADFSTVRVHTDVHAQTLARSVNAQAFTVGRDVVFDAGHYSPATDSGKRLLAHELTHVVQQSAVRRLDRKPATTDWVVQRSADGESGRVSAIPRPTLLSAARGSDPHKDPFKPGRTIEDWANGTIDVSTLQPSELQLAIDELHQWLDRQNGSSFKGVRIERALGALRAELSKRYVATKTPARDRGGRGNTAKPADRPKVSPRVLTEKNVSIGYRNPAEARAEFDLIMQWLTVPGLERDKRALLLKERTNLESLLGMERKREASERYVSRVRAALTSNDKNPADALKTVVRTIEGISKDPVNGEISYIYHQGERLAISTEQATHLRSDMLRTLSRAAFEIWEGVAQQSLRDRARQVKINEESRFTSRVSEIFTGHLLSYADDPYEKMLHLNGDVFDDYRTIREHLKAGRLTDAAGLLPHMEKQAREMEDLAKEFTGTYLRGAERAVATFKITAQLAVSIELAILTAGTASFVSGLVEGAGLTGIGAGTATVLGTGTLVAGETAVVRGGIAFGDAMLTGQSLGEALHATKGAAFEGLKEGFFAGATAGGGRVLASAFGVGKNVAYQAARRAGAEAIANGTSSIVKAIIEKKSPEEVLEEGLRSALSAVPGALIGSGGTKRLIAGSLAAYGTAFADVYSRPGASMEDALAAASVAMATHLAASRLGHETDAALVKRAHRVGKAVKNTAINTTLAIAIRAAAPRQPSVEMPSAALHDTAERTGPPVPDEGQPNERREQGRDQTRAAELDASAPVRHDERSIVGLSEQDLRHLAAEALRRPINDPDGKVHIYPTVEAFEAAYRRLSPNGRPTRAFFNRDTGEIHLSPNAKIKSGIHEMTHGVREAENQWGRDYIGGFLDEGVTDAIAIERTGQDVNRSGYKKNIAFYRVLKSAIGGSPEIELAIVHGEYGALRAKIKQLFGGSELRTFEFFNKLRGIGAHAENPVALDEAVAMLEQASGRTAAELSGWQAAAAAGSASPAGDAGTIEHVGPFSLIGAKATVDRPQQGRVVSRRIGALIRSGVPIADADLRPLMGHLLSDARAAGATRLRIVPEFLSGLKVPSLTAVVESLGGTVRPIGSAFEIDIPVTRSFGSRRQRGVVPNAAEPRHAAVEQADVRARAQDRRRSTALDLSELDDEERVTSGASATNAASAGSIQGLIDEAATLVRALDDGHPLRRDLEQFIAEANTSDGWVGKAIRAGGDKATQARHEVQRLTNGLAEIKRDYPNDLLQAIADGEGPTRVDAIPLGATAEARPGLRIRSSDTEAEISGGNIPHREPAPEPHLPEEQPSIVLGDGLEAEAAPPVTNEFTDDIPTLDIKPKGGSSERNTMDRGDGGGRNPSDSDPLPPIPRTGRNSPERLFELLEKGGSRRLRQATVAGQGHKPKPGVFRRGMTSPRAAYRAFNKALTQSAGHEVGIFYNAETGEYAVIIDSAVAVSAPANERGWIGIVHFHHNEFNSWVLRLPSPRSDFSDLWARTRSENARVREFVEWNDPAGGRGRTELGIDLAWPDKPIYVRIVEPNGKQWIERFKTEADYHRFYDSHTKFVEAGSPLHDWIITGARR